MEPKEKFRVGGVTASIFENVRTNNGGEAFTSQHVVVDRSYKDKSSGEWKNTTSLGVGDVPKAILALQKAYEHMVLTGNSENGGKFEFGGA